jgi:pyruvate formate lyase activating enzyme
MKGLIFNVKRYSVHDGPGIRVTFFMKGCPLSCRWCHNPEGISPDMESVDLTEKVGEKEFIRKEEAGKYYSPGDIIKILERERIFMNHSGGGVTFSGGEPLHQADFLAEVLSECRNSGYHTAVDTCGYAETSKLHSIVPDTDLFLYDIKHIDDNVHYLNTGVSNALILNNFTFLLDLGKDIIVRIPVIPGFNDDPLSLDQLRSFLAANKKNNLKRIDLLPYHRAGIAKYSKFGRKNKMDETEQPGKVRMQELKDFFSLTGIKIKIGG